MTPASYIVMLFGFPFMAGSCFVLYALLFRRKTPTIYVAVFLINSLASPAAYYFHVQGRLEQSIDELGADPMCETKGEEIAGLGSWAVPGRHV